MIYSVINKSRDVADYYFNKRLNGKPSAILMVSGVETLTIRKDCYIDSRVRVGCNAISTGTIANRTVVLKHYLVILEQRISSTSRLRQLLSSGMD